MTMNTLEDLFHDALADMYFAEKKITKALPKMAKAATNEDLAEAFESHLEETKEQIEKLEKVFELCDLKKKTKECKAIEGLLEEGEELMKESEEGPVRDAALILAAQKVEHYEIASYGCLCALANELGFDEASKLLHEILVQERNADSKLSMLATARGINDGAMAEAA